MEGGQGHSVRGTVLPTRLRLDSRAKNPLVIVNTILYTISVKEKSDKTGDAGSRVQGLNGYDYQTAQKDQKGDVQALTYYRCINQLINWAKKENPSGVAAINEMLEKISELVSDDKLYEKRAFLEFSKDADEALRRKINTSVAELPEKVQMINKLCEDACLPCIYSGPFDWESVYRFARDLGEDYFH